MKRKLFIGSSTEGYKIALQLKKLLETEFGDWLDCETWKEGKAFKLNNSFLKSLVNASRRYDYGIFVATNDDLGLIRASIKRIPRDNVIFEMGLFLGSLGFSRAFLFAQSGNKLPSDYNGITISTFSKKNIIREDIEPLLEQLKSTKETFVLKTIPSVALAIGYFDNFIHPVGVKLLNKENLLKIIIPKTLDNLNLSFTIYRENNPSEEISIYEDNARPTVNRLLNNLNQFWDIPSTLSTLNKLITLVDPPKEVGINSDKKNWIEHELRNFKGTIEVLIQDMPYKNKIEFDFL